MCSNAKRISEDPTDLSEWTTAIVQVYSKVNLIHIRLKKMFRVKLSAQHHPHGQSAVYVWPGKPKSLEAWLDSMISTDANKQTHG